MNRKTCIYTLLVTGMLLGVSGSALADTVGQVPIAASLDEASNEAQNSYEVETDDVLGIAKATCQWDLLVNQLLISAAEADTLAVAGSNIMEGIDFGEDGRDGFFPGVPLSHGSRDYATADSGTAKCDTVMRNVRIQASLDDGFGLESPDGEGFTGFLGEDADFGGQSGADDTVVQVPIAIGLNAVENELGNEIEQDHDDTFGSAFATCQWFLAVNTVMISLGDAGAEAFANSDIVRDGEIPTEERAVTPAGFGGPFQNAGGATATCSTVIDNFELVVDMEGDEEFETGT